MEKADDVRKKKLTEENSGRNGQPLERSLRVTTDTRKEVRRGQRWIRKRKCLGEVTKVGG